LYEKSFIVTPQEIDKYLPIQLEAGQILTTGLLIFFLKKSFLGTQVPISLEIHKEFFKIQSGPRSCHARRFGRILKLA
jgi:hypothetical protein